MEGLHVSAHAEGIIAAEIAEIAVELHGVGAVKVPDVSLHVGFVHALVRAKGTGELRAARVHLATELQMLLQLVLWRKGFLTERTRVLLGRVGCRIVRVDDVLYVPFGDV